MQDLMDVAALLGNAAVTGALAVVSVSLWTLRVALTSAGRRLAGAGVAGVEAVVFTAAFGRIVADLDNPVGLAAYALGVALGTFLGLAIDERVSAGQSWVRIFVLGDGAAAAEALHRRRWPVTVIPATGPAGPVAELVVAVDDARLPELTDDVEAAAPGAFRSVERLRTSRGGPLPVGFRQVGDQRRHRQGLGRRLYRPTPGRTAAWEHTRTSVGSATSRS